MSERIIQAADLSRIAHAISSLGDDLHTVSQQINDVDQVVSITRSELNDLRGQLRDFELRYERSTEIGLAETRLVKVRQELEHRFGHHSEIRRAATGLLQAADLRIVRQDTVDKVTEELMLLAPGYWLAPALVALAAWLRDDQALAQRALAEALRRDDEKTSLFFGLISRRAQRTNACAVWLDRYLGNQDPHQLNRQTIVLVDATAAGVFTPDVQQRCIQRFEAWLDELKSKTDFVETQRQQWRDALAFRIPQDQRDTAYPYLSKHSSTWLTLERVLNRAAVNVDLLKHFAGIFDAPLPSPARFIDAVDDQLMRLVSDHDAAELALRQDEALLELIIAEGGRKDDAVAKFNLEHKALEEAVSFTQLLTNAAMHPEKSGATLASQRLALALSREWVREAHADLTLETRAGAPVSIALAIDHWSGSSRDGENESELVADLEHHIARLGAAALAGVKFGATHWIVGGLGVVFIASAIATHWLLALVGLGMLAWVWAAKGRLEKARAKIRDAFEQRREGQVAILRACLSEIVEWRRDFQRRDQISDDVGAFISAITPDAHLGRAKDGVRRVALTQA